MTNHFARLRNNHGAWLQALLTNQAEEIGTERTELEDFVRLSTGRPRALIALDNPAPARGYALMLAESFGDRGDVIARVHLLDGVADAGVRALFSQMTVHARRLAKLNPSDPVRIAVDTSALAPHVVEMIEYQGEPYGVYLVDAEQVPSTVDKDGEEKITAEEAAGGDLADPEVKQFFEERGVEVTETEDEEPDEFASDEAVKESAPESDDQEDEEHPYECFDCGERFATPQALGSHSRKHK